ncbi:MAG: hypothetical protein AAFP18_10410 [Bacteroidota bacterium]
MDRRDFLLRSALVSAGLALAASSARALTDALVSGRVGAQTGYVGMASRVAIADALRLAVADQTTPADLRATLAMFDQQAVAADSVPATPAEVVSLLGDLRTLWANRDDRPHDRSGYRGDMAEQRLAWALGWVGHYAAAPVLGQPDADVSRMRDAALLRALHEASPAEDTRPDVASLAELLRVVDQRVGIRLHTYTPDRDDVVDWVPRFVAWDQARYDEAERLALAVLDGAPDLAFLNPADPAFQAAHAVRQARPVSPKALDAAAEAPGASIYARAVGASFRAMRAAGHHFAGRLSAADLLAQLSS